MSTKAPDTNCIPLCPHHHRILHELGPRRFEDRFGLNIRELVARLNAKPKLTVESGIFIAVIQDKEYIVGPIGMGIETAIRRVGQLWWEDRKDLAS